MQVGFSYENSEQPESHRIVIGVYTEHINIMMQSLQKIDCSRCLIYSLDVFMKRIPWFVDYGKAKSLEILLTIRPVREGNA